MYQNNMLQLMKILTSLQIKIFFQNKREDRKKKKIFSSQANLSHL